MTALYCEIEPYAAQWMRNLIAAGHIAPGVVDERSLEDLDPEYVSQFTQAHFCAGIAVWSLALRQAGWPDDRRVWTASLPCQPFSAAGQGAGFADERHLWPSFHYLVQQCRPAVILGEQVASRDANPWLDLVQADLEGLGYGVGAVPFPAAGVGAPHIRDRLYWMAHTSSTRPQGGERSGQRDDSQCAAAERNGAAGGVGNANSINARWNGGNGTGEKTPSDCSGSLDGPERYCADVASGTGDAGPTNGLWRDADWLGCRDGKWRPVEPGTFPLADAGTVGNRVGQLRAAGNAITLGQAQTFIECVIDVIDNTPYTPTP